MQAVSKQLDYQVVRPPRDASQPRYYRPELDVLRFAAFFMVFLSHVVPGEEALFERAGVPSSLARSIIFAAAGGAFGVDLFFALSSFLITTLLLREHQNFGRIDVPRFYARRILRIWPLYFAFLFCASTLTKYVVHGDEFPPKYIAAFVFLCFLPGEGLSGFPRSGTPPNLV